ncbi:DUF475 domain-containing protein [Leptospira selangorensis]|uniref:DUF475 domain-containing protein n=1 Tax=Leptospira selangorensis TaxID=2484982 RepID=A0ABY2NHM3_9LEPT|nr:DUF475 domain-containing protein [Leptospira selangorensis]TGM27912.1 DUF475 domain-containing protein [Leptospira selangorensis]
MSNIKYFKSSFIVTFLGLILGAFVGYYYKGTPAGAMEALFICAVLVVLEVSISFDNAVVNATVLKDMTPAWQHRFLTWGMLIAVFGMRLVFPLVIVAVVASLNPWEALVMAATEPDRYAQIMTSVHHEVAAFGGAFLMLVALKYFFDVEKDVHWIRVIERPLARMGRLNAVEVGLTLLFIYLMSNYVGADERMGFTFAGIAGILTFLGVEAVGTFLQAPEATVKDIHKASAGMFLYLEVLDASFSFDGVIGAFAVTNNLFIFAIGLGIGAMFVRSLTIMMVDKGTLEAFRFMEHGAFYAVWALAIIMFVGTVVHIPEVITGLVGAAFIGLSIWDSRRKHAQ